MFQTQLNFPKCFAMNLCSGHVACHLVQQMRITVQDLVQRKRHELHETVAVPREQFTQERDRLIALASTESEAPA